MDQETKLPPLSPDRKTYLFGCLLNLPALFAKAKDILRPEDIFAAHDISLGVLWRAVLIIAKRNLNTIPTPADQARIQIEIETKELCNGDPETVTQEYVNDLFGTPTAPADGLINYIYAQSSESWSEQEGTRLLRRYLEELTLFKPVRDAAYEWNQTLPASLEPFLEKLQLKRAQIAGLDQSAIFPAYSAELAPPKIEIMSTGVPFLDRFMAGGQAYGEAYLVIGPTGTGKSTMGAQLAVEGARLQQRRNEVNPDETLGHWYIFTYELPVVPDLQMRIWSYAAQVAEDSLRDETKLSSRERGDYKAYERSLVLPGHLGSQLPGEVERLAVSRNELGNSNLWLVDYSGSFPGVGLGGVDEIAAALANEVHRGRRIAGVVIDWVGQGVTRYMLSRNIDPRLEYRYFQHYMDEVRMKLTGRFNCVCWAFHQLQGDCSNRSPQTVFHHSQARGCRNMADTAWFAFTLSNKDDATQTMLVNCSKARRAPTMQPALVLFEGHIRKLTPADDKYALDPVQRKAVLKSQLNKVVRPQDLKVVRPGRNIFAPEVGLN